MVSRITQKQDDIVLFTNRIISVDPFLIQNSRKLPDNKIVSTRYTFWNFIFLNLCEQYHSVSTFVFTILAITNLFVEGSVNKFFIITPVLIIISIAMVKDAYYDIKRHRRDRFVNNRPVIVLDFATSNFKTTWSNKKSHEIIPGDILLCKNHDQLPCDMLLLAASDKTGKVLITTANLDGESTIKNFYADNRLQSYFENNFLDLFDQVVLSTNLNHLNSGSSPNAQNLWLKVLHEKSNADLNNFSGKFSYDNSNWYALTKENLALRGSRLKGTDFIIGMALYTGKYTKLSQNSKNAKHKMSSIQARLNFILTFFFAASVLLSIIFAIASFSWLNSNVPWYIPRKNMNVWAFYQEVMRFSYIFTYIMPISMIITMEIQQILLSMFLSNDIVLYDEVRDINCTVSTVNLTDELGQIEFLFSDKTGTLTENIMKLKKFSTLSTDNTYVILGDSCIPVQELDCCDQNTEITSVSTNKSNHDFHANSQVEHSDGMDRRARNNFSSDARDFLVNLALCHSVDIQSSINGSDLVIKYQTTSPDEKALVEAAASMGLIVELEAATSMSEETSSTFSLGSVRQLNMRQSKQRCNTLAIEDGIVVRNIAKHRINRRFTIDAILPFDSFVKRMSVMVRFDDGSCHVICKGAECVMLTDDICSRSPTNQSNRSLALRHVTSFANQGLRTLVFGRKQLDRDAYDQLLSELSRSGMHFGADRESAFQRARSRIESNLELVGVTGVEDKLQSGVRECLESLKEAGIQTWVLTGDKEETALSVSYLSGHFPSIGTTLLRLTNCGDFESTACHIFTHLSGMSARLEQRSFARSHPQQHEPPLLMPPTSQEVDDVVMAAAEQSPEVESPAFPIEESSTSSGGNRHSPKTFFANKRLSKRLLALHRRLTSLVGATGRRMRIPRRRRRRRPGAAGEPIGLVIDGQSLQFALHPSLRTTFLDLCMNVSAVLCCRLSPLQKASVVELVQEGLKGKGDKPVTAAIGDGGNDVAMIRQASVGIGIHGLEGREAVRSADFALSKFNDLHRLILVHGFTNYQRISQTMNLFYNKCVAFVVAQTYLLFYDGFSPMTWYDGLLFSLFNFTMTGLSAVVFGAVEKHVNFSALEQAPYLYRLISRNANLELGYVLLWVIDGVWIGTVVFYFSFYMLAGSSDPVAAIAVFEMERRDLDFSLTGCASYFYLITAINGRIFLHSRELNVFVALGTLIPIVLNAVILIIVQYFADLDSLLFRSITKLFLCPSFWLGLPVVTLASLLPVTLWRLVSDLWWTNRITSAICRNWQIITKLKQEQKQYQQPATSVDSESGSGSKSTGSSTREVETAFPIPPNTLYSEDDSDD